jgi:hypothetical protein
VKTGLESIHECPSRKRILKHSARIQPWKLPVYPSKTSS